MTQTTQSINQQVSDGSDDLCIDEESVPECISAERFVNQRKFTIFESQLKDILTEEGYMKQYSCCLTLLHHLGQQMVHAHMVPSSYELGSLDMEITTYGRTDPNWKSPCLGSHLVQWTAI